MILQRNATKRGVASFYVVAFSTLILLIIVVSFASLVVSQLERSSNADLSQSAYDAALAGIEDAKLAYANYRYCAEGGSDKDGLCGRIMNVIKDPKCGMVDVMLGRTSNTDGYSGTNIEGSESNDLQQAYTCVKIDVRPSEQVNDVQPFEPTVFRPEFEGENGVNRINSIKVEWVSGETISVAIVQTRESAENQIEDFMKVVENENDYRTNGGMVYLEPNAENCKDNACDNTEDNIISKQNIVKSNDKTVENKPYHIECGGPDGKQCEATIEIPSPYSDPGSSTVSRSSFEVIVSKPGGQPERVSVKYCNELDCSDGSVMKIKNQFVVDSTGRANDMFRRVKATISTEDSVGVMGPLEVEDLTEVK